MVGLAACLVLLAIGVPQETASRQEPQEARPKVEKLFDGKTLEGWSGDPRYWRVEDGRIVGETTAEQPLEQNTFLIWQGKPVEDFELRLKYRLTAGNSGIQYRSRVLDEKQWIVGGYQADLCQLTPRQSWILGILYEEKGRGILARRGQRIRIASDGSRTEERFAEEDELVSHLKDGEWFEYVIRAEGPRLTHRVGGRLLVDVIDESEEESVRSGTIAFQLHVGPPMRVEYQDIELRRLH